jgi:hypothetical protein
MEEVSSPLAAPNRIDHLLDFSLVAADAALVALIESNFAGAKAALDGYDTERVNALLRVPFGLSDAGSAELAGHLLGVHHVGFLLPRQAEPHLERLARQAGFRGEHRAYPSALVARELGTLAGKELVPTTIHHFDGRSQSGSEISVEVFVPDAPEEQVRSWIGQGVAAHLALRARSRAAIFAIFELLGAAGNQLASFMKGRPMENPSEGSISLYYDLALDPDRSFRVQFYQL